MIVSQSLTRIVFAVPKPDQSRVKAVSVPYLLRIKVPLYGAAKALIRTRYGADLPVNHLFATTW
ncbi:hypothetical protein [Bacteroides sp. UBA939]|uniref:hypothetical protein n=1 Tax=Bacteroides sp. UBA939 TaxID=1946092 RepID=UPI0025C58276|nr:hypothetical protein [Bacteroides sp. UBA939]